MSETTFVTLFSLALVLPTASILPVVLHLLKVVKHLDERMRRFEEKHQCPYRI